MQGNTQAMCSDTLCPSGPPASAQLNEEPANEPTRRPSRTGQAVDMCSLSEIPNPRPPKPPKPPKPLKSPKPLNPLKPLKTPRPKALSPKTHGIRTLGADSSMYLKGPGPQMPRFLESRVRELWGRQEILGLGFRVLGFRRVDVP